MWRKNFVGAKDGIGAERHVLMGDFIAPGLRSAGQR